MKILMLGWEYPPHISGGLGTACEGLTTSLAGRGIEIDFLVPRLYGEENAPHMHLLGAASAAPAAEIPARAPDPLAALLAAEPSLGTDPIVAAAAEAAYSQAAESNEPSVQMLHVPAMLKPYLDQATYRELVTTGALTEDAATDMATSQIAHPLPEPPHEVTRLEHVHIPGDELPFAEEAGTGAHYGQDLFSEVARYAMAATRRVHGRKYDLVHAHDWMTFPAGIEIARRAGAPLTRTIAPRSSICSAASRTELV